MAQFIIDIEDPAKLAGITAAREAYNESNADAEDFVPLDTDEEYVQFVMDGAAASYANQYGVE